MTTTTPLPTLRERLAAARKPECGDCDRVVERGAERCPHCGNAVGKEDPCA